MNAHPNIGYIIAFFAVLMAISVISHLTDGDWYTIALGAVFTAVLGLVASCLIHPPPSKTV